MMTKNDYNGILIVDKPAGWTSHDVVQKTRNMLRVKKVGHTGTLDPMATGVLVLLIGRATKSASFFENDSKRYHAEITFGSATDTYDAEGNVTDTGDPAHFSETDLLEGLARFSGVIEQIPPMYSALKVKGKKLYDLARAGKTIERKPRKVTIQILSKDLSCYPVTTLDIECSKGTYIRSIAHDWGGAVGCPAHLSNLVRTASGHFGIDGAVDFLDAVDNKNVELLIRNIQPVPERIQPE